MANTLPVSRYIQISVALTALAAQGQALNQLLVLGDTGAINAHERLRAYETLAQVATDFGTTAPEYLAAQSWFDQLPQPDSLLIGFWAKNATAALLVGGAVSASNQVIAAWTAITTGSLKVTINGTLKDLTGLDFHSVTALTGVAGVITTALGGAGTVTWDATYERFQLKSATTGAGSTMTFMTAEGTGVDVTLMLAMRSTSSGAYVVDSIGTPGVLTGGTVPTLDQVYTAWTSITDGSFKVTIDGSLKDITGTNFSTALSMDDVATLITAKLSGAGTVAWDGTNKIFTLTSASSGPGSTVTFMTAEGAGTDLTPMLAMLVTSPGAFTTAGAAETAVNAVSQVFDADYNQLWYALFIPQAANADHLAVAAYIEGADTKHVYGVNTQEAGVITTGDTSSIAYQLKALNYKKTCVQYSSTSLYAVASLLGRILTTNYAGINTAITLMYKQEPGIVAENLNTTQANAAVAVHANFVAEVENDTAILQNGVCCSGDWIDTIIYADAFVVTMMTALYNLLYTTTTKVPQTDAGTHLLVTTIVAVCQQFVNNGYLGPGQWNANGFGNLVYGQWLPDGYYVYGPPITSQSQADRALRKSVPIQVAAKTAGAVHIVVVLVEINQ